MADVQLKGITKTFGKTVAANDVTFHVREGEFFSLLGASGCGKTTTLRIIGGFEEQDSGDVYIGGELVNDIPPWKRDTATVFQSYAIWPHMNVYENVAYGLKLRKLPKQEIENKVEKLLDLTKLRGLQRRDSGELSGGQQQRVALARALVVEPGVLLMDEPLSNLDARLRVKTRDEIKEIQKKTKNTIIWVTHDQEEALGISDRIAVMNSGKIVQIDTPLGIYRNPANPYVANFIGITNMMKGKLQSFNTRTLTATIKTDAGLEIHAKTRKVLKRGKRVMISVRPETIRLFDSKRKAMGKNVFEGNVKKATFLGPSARYKVELDGGEMFKVDVQDVKSHKIWSKNEKVILVFNEQVVEVIPT